MQTDQYVSGAYLEKNPDWHERDAAWKAAQVLRMVSRHGLVFDAVYDVGCGGGDVLAELQKAMGAQTRFAGFDVSPQAIALAKTKENDRLSFFNDGFPTSERSAPGLLLLLDVFEHVQDYLGFLKRLSADAGWVILHIPLDINAEAVLCRSKWMLHMRRQYGHLHYFTKETALATLADAGYEVVDWFYTDDQAAPQAWVPRGLKLRTLHEARKLAFRLHADSAVSVFDSFNLLVLARGARQSDGCDDDAIGRS